MIPASHPIQPPEERRPLTRWEFASLFLAQMGKCKNCGAKLEKGKTRDEHLHALDLGGGNELSNRALWCLDCTKPKDDLDKARSAKGRRIRGEVGNGPKRKIVSRNSFGKRSRGDEGTESGGSYTSRSQANSDPLLIREAERESRSPSSWSRKPEGFVSPLSKKSPRYRKQAWGRK